MLMPDYPSPSDSDSVSISLRRIQIGGRSDCLCHDWIPSRSGDRHGHLMLECEKCGALVCWTCVRESYERMVKFFRPLRVTVTRTK